MGYCRNVQNRPNGFWAFAFRCSINLADSIGCFRLAVKGPVPWLYTYDTGQFAPLLTELIKMWSGSFDGLKRVCNKRELLLVVVGFSWSGAGYVACLQCVCFFEAHFINQYCMFTARDLKWPHRPNLFSRIGILVFWEHLFSAGRCDVLSVCSYVDGTTARIKHAERTKVEMLYP